MKRRTLLRTSAAAVGGSAAALAGVELASDEASAETALALDIAGDSATVGTDESVTALRLSADVEWAYDLPDSAAPSTAIVELAAGVESVSVVDTAESAQLFVASDGEEGFDVDLLGDVLEASAITPESGSRETTVTVEARFRVEDADGDVLAREVASDTAPVTVEREAAPATEYGDVGGSGEVTIEIG
jgi:hypothetical protein